jgi:hypothetical protein
MFRKKSTNWKDVADDQFDSLSQDIRDDWRDLRELTRNRE